MPEPDKRAYIWNIFEFIDPHIICLITLSDTPSWIR
jgi:hypothetical protein